MKNLKICILGSYENRLDEGMANVSFHIYKNLKTIYPNTILLNVANAFSLGFWKTVLNTKPDIIHLIPGPTFKLLLLAKIIKKLTNSIEIVSATKNALTSSFRVFSKVLKPDLVIVNSENSETFFKSFYYKTKFLPNGVDTNKFVGVDGNKKIELRKKYGLEQDDFIILHVGPLVRGRNQRTLLEIPDVKILLVLSLTNSSEEKEFQKLSKPHVIIWKKFLPNIEEIYQLSDLYIFPVFDRFQSIEIPLSILEAMSCNLPVITSRYGGGLERIIKEENGLIFIENLNQLKEAVSKIRAKKSQINTRNKVENLSWKNIVNEIATIYEEFYK